MNAQPMLLTDRILTVPQVAVYLQISKSKIYYLISRRQIPHIRLGRNVRIRESDLTRWLERSIEAVASSPPSRRGN